MVVWSVVSSFSSHYLVNRVGSSRIGFVNNGMSEKSPI